MTSPDERPSLWDIRGCLLSSIDFADALVHDRPEHAAAVSSFSHEVRRLKTELMTAFKDEMVPAPFHDIVNGLTGAKAMAEIMAERHPEKSGLLTKFVEGLNQAQAKFIRKVRPELYRETPV